MKKIYEMLEFLRELKIEYVFYGDEETNIEGYSSLKNYRDNTFTWAKNEKALSYDWTDKTLAIAQDGLDITAKNIVCTKESKRAFFSLIEWFESEEVHEAVERIGLGTVIGSNVQLGKNVIIGANCVIQGKIVIGDNVRIWNNVTIINNVVIGNDCEIQSGSVIGHDGFAWIEFEDQTKKMIRHFGGVRIDDNVYIGPNCVIDRGEIDDTLIKSGVKIDANCFLAHNVIVEENAILITGSKMYGSSELGANAYLASALVRNQCRVGENTFVGMGAVVTKNLPKDSRAVGVPAHVI